MILCNIMHCFLSGLLIWFCTSTSSFLADFYALIASILLGAIIAYWLLPVTKRWCYGQRISPTNNSIFITGCDSGFGHALAKQLNAEGFNVFASCLFPDGPGAQSLKQMESNRMHVLNMDVTKDDSVDEAVNYVKKHLNDSVLWAVVNNAGIYEGFEIAWTPLESYEKCFQVNTLGVVRVTKAFLPLLRKSKGRVITLTSITGRISIPHISAYEMSKFAVVCFCECLRQELYPWNIKVISIEPELYKTALSDVTSIEKKITETLENVDQGTKEEYGEEYFDDYLKYVALNVAKMASPNLNKVLESLMDAVSLHEPRDVYKPCRHKIVRWGIWMMEVLPKPTLDACVRLYNYTSRFPVPKESHVSILSDKNKLN